MKTVTNNFKEEIRKLGKEIDFKIFLYANDKLITQNNNFIMTQDNLNLVVEQFNQEEIEYTINSDEIYNVSVVNRGELLSTMMKEVDFEVSKELKVGDVISCEFGLKVGNSYEYVDYGKYMIYEKEFNEDTKTYSYVAYDRMLLTMREIPNPSNFENKNILSVIQEICTITNLEFNGTSETALTYPNLNKVINQGTFTDLVMTYRDMLDMICQALGLSMVVEDNELVLKDINEKERTLVGKNSLYLEDAMEQNVINYSVDGVCEQNGTPTPSSPQNVETIPSTVNLYYGTSNEYNFIATTTWNYVNGQGGATGSSIGANTSYKAKVENGKTYILQANATNINVAQICYSDETIIQIDSQNNISSSKLKNGVKFTATRDDYVVLRLNCTSGNNVTINNVQLEKGTVAHEYIPYGYWSRVKVTGKNLFSGYEVGYINSSNGNDETNNNCHRSFYIPVKPNTTYTTSTLITRFVEYNKNKGFIQCLFNTSNSITTTANTYYLRLGFNDTVSTSDLDVEMLEEGTTATPYEQYKEKEVLIDMSKPNLFDKDNTNILDVNLSNDNYISGQSPSNRVLYIPIKENTTYTINKVLSSYFRIGTTTDIPTYNEQYYQKITNNTGTSITITTNQTAKYLIVWYYNSGADTLTEQQILDSIQIFEGTSPTPYYELCSNKDKTVKDRLLVDTNGNCSIIKNIGKRVFNGSESWEIANTGQTYNDYLLTLSQDTILNYEAFTNYFTCNTQLTPSTWNQLSNNQAFIGRNKRQFIFRYDAMNNNLNNWKTWLSTHNTDVYYPLATPETITLPNTQIPLYEGINHITLVDDLDTDTSVVYNSSNLAVEEIDETYLNDTNVSFRKKYGPINSVVLSRSEDYDTIYRRDEESIEKNGLCEYKIKDNPILLYNDREEYIDEIFNQLKGIEYYPNDYLSKGITFLDWLDFYNVKIGDNTYKCLMLNDEIKVEQGLEESVYSEIPEETVTDYKTSSKTDKEVSFIVDKQKGQINAKVSKGDVINEINLDESGASINADKISLAGKTISMTSDDITINSTNFNVDKNGNVTANNMTANDINIKSGNIELIAPASTPLDPQNAKLILKTSNNNERYKNELFSNGMDITAPANNNQSIFRILAVNSVAPGRELYSNVIVQLFNEFDLISPSIELDSQSGWITCVGLEQTSLEKEKKNFEKLKNGLDIIKNIEIYKYHFKNQNKNEKKHIGFVIGNDFKYSQEITSNDNDGVDIYSFVSVCCKAIQEQQEQINSLKEEMKQLKEENK